MSVESDADEFERMATECDRMRTALHGIAALTHQDVDRPASWWGLLSDVHLKARRGLGECERP